MTKVVCLTFNPFQENTYIVLDEESRACVIIDPGCYTPQEEAELARTIASLALKPVRLLNTHCHLDHIFGNAFAAETFQLSLEIHPKEITMLERSPQAAQFYGVPFPRLSPSPSAFLEEGDVVAFGKVQLEVLHTPGHSPGSVCFFCRHTQQLIAGDVLFFESIGRTDLPGGDHDTLIETIIHKLLPLGDSVQVFPGHGPATSIGYERLHNPFLQ